MTGPSRGPYSMVEVNPMTDPGWRELVTSRRSDLFHSPDWTGAIYDTYGFGLRARILYDHERPVAGLVFAEIDDLIGRRIVSLPFSDFCDPLVDDMSQWNLLTEGLFDRSSPFTVKRRFDGIVSGDPRLAEVGRAKWHRVNLGRTPDEIWASLDSGARRAISKARKSGVMVRPAACLDDVRAFFELHLRVRKYKYALLAQPWPFFEAIWKRFLEPGEGELVLAEFEREVIGGVLFLDWADTTYYKFNASSADSLALRPNDLVLWTGILRGAERGFAWLDFGVSDLDQDGLIRYKRKYASEESEVVTLRHEVAPDHRGRGARSLLPALTDLFVDPSVPDAVSERAGNLLYRYFS